MPCRVEHRPRRLSEQPEEAALVPHARRLGVVALERGVRQVELVDAMLRDGGGRLAARGRQLVGPVPGHLLGRRVGGAGHPAVVSARKRKRSRERRGQRQYGVEGHGCLEHARGQRVKVVVGRVRLAPAVGVDALDLGVRVVGQALPLGRPSAGRHERSQMRDANHGLEHGRGGRECVAAGVAVRGHDVFV